MIDRPPFHSIEYTGNNEETIRMGAVLGALSGIVIGAILFAVGIVTAYNFYIILGFVALAAAFIVGSYGSHPPVEQSKTTHQ